MVFSLFKKKEKSDAPAKAATMKAVQIDAYGDLSEMKYRDAPKPVPEPGEVLVRVRAAGANPFDCKVRRGILKDFYRLDMPVTLGSDFAGEIEAVGDGVPGAMRPGDRVYGLSTPMDGGTYAEYLTIDHKFARPMPQVSFEDASVMPMVGQTAWYGLVNLANVSAGQKVLVHAGAGGVGAMAIQIAKHFGAHVVTTCSTRNCDLVKELGADEIVDYTQSDFRTAIKDVDIAIDPLGGDVNLHTYEVMKPGGTILVVLRYNPVEMQNRAAMTEKYGVVVKEVAFDNQPEILDELKELAERGVIRSNLKAVLPLADAAEAHERLETGHNAGKIALKVD